MGDLNRLLTERLGNINLFARPKVHNADGTYSTLRSMSFGENGKEILVPTVEEHGNGILSDEDAIKQYHRTGKYLGKFNSIPEADKYADLLHLEGASGLTTPPLASSHKDVDPDRLKQVLLWMLQK
jgi:hypothetical protein